MEKKEKTPAPFKCTSSAWFEAGLAESPKKGQYVISPKGKIALGLPEVTKEKAFEILTHTPGDKAFHFYAGIGKPMHLYAYDLSDFCNKLNTVGLETVSFHLTRRL